MKKSGFTIINFIILGIGILFIAACRRDDFIHSLVFFSGICFIIPGVVNIFSLIRSSKKSNIEGDDTNERPRQSTWSRFTNWSVSTAAVVLGAMMCFTPETFRTPLIYIFALSIFFGGLYHTYMMLRGLRPAKVDAWTYAFPAAITIIACILFFIPSLRQPDNQTTVILLTGIAMILFAIASFFESLAIRAYNRYLASQPTLPDATSAPTEATSTANPYTTHPSDPQLPN